MKSKILFIVAMALGLAAQAQTNQSLDEAVLKCKPETPAARKCFRETIVKSDKCSVTETGIDCEKTPLVLSKILSHLTLSSDCIANFKVRTLSPKSVSLWFMPSDPSKQTTCRVHGLEIESGIGLPFNHATKDKDGKWYAPPPVIPIGLRSIVKTEAIIVTGISSRYKFSGERGFLDYTEPSQILLGDSYVSAFVNPTMAEIVKVLDEVGNQVTPQDFYHNDGTLPFAQKTGSHRGHNTGKMLDVRTFGIGPSTYEFVDNKSTNATPAQMFVATNTKYADLARLMKMSYRALEFNKTVETGKLKTAAQCQTESGTNPPTCTPSTELTIEKCLIAWIELSTSELSEKEVTCANMRTNVESYEITKQQILDSHSRYRDYILRNRQALLRFKELMQERGLAMPMIMYSFGDNETSREAISLMADIDISTDAIWNLRSLKDGTIPLDENRSATDRISLLTQDGVPIGTSTAHSMLREDKSHTHLDHYHFEEIEK